MTIAILGWGSLIWNPASLEIEKENQENKWHIEGPVLPIEFSRISFDGRLTLVIDNNNGTHVQTLYSISKFKELDEAVLNLATREDSGINKIGFYNRDSVDFNPPNFPFQQNILDWINKKNIDAVIWTNLSPSFKDKTGKQFNKKNVIGYLNNLTMEVKAKAEEYIRRTPLQIKTKMRSEIENALGWKAFSL